LREACRKTGYSARHIGSQSYFDFVVAVTDGDSDLLAVANACYRRIKRIDRETRLRDQLRNSLPTAAELFRPKDVKDRDEQPLSIAPCEGGWNV
jgi:hypothetical protein